MKTMLALALLFILYQIPGLQTPLRWIVGIILLGLLVKYQKTVFSEFETAFKGGQ